MNPTTTGYGIFIAALGMMLGLLAVDVSSLHSWGEALAPGFIGGALGHFSVVIAAFVGGKLIPVDRDPNERTRAADMKVNV